jgi:hypothetical protein
MKSIKLSIVALFIASASFAQTKEVKVENVNVANNLIEYISYIHAYIIFIKQTTFVTILTVGVYCNLI